ncbi:MAG: hypothetical protein AB7E47_15735 [Desulfovibrionaceae bacterium]
MNAKHSQRLFVPLLALLCVALFSGCGGGGYSRPAPTPPPPPAVEEVQPPQQVNVHLTIQDWQIIDNSVLDYSGEWGKFRYDGTYRYARNFVLKFKSSKFPNNYWLAVLPTEANGEFTISAKLFQEHGTAPKPATPPSNIPINLTIKKKKIIDAEIVDPHPGWGQFTVSKYVQGILYLRNAFYPGELWAAQLPSASQGDGEWTINALLQKASK